MKKYKLKPTVTSVGMRNNGILKDKNKVVDGSMFNNAEDLVSKGFLIEVEQKKAKSKTDKKESKSKSDKKSFDE